MPGEPHAGPAPYLAGAESPQAVLPLKLSLILFAIFVIAILPLLTAPVLPLIDFYNHIARYHVLSHLDAEPFLQQNYQANWLILPNIGIDAIVVGLSRLLPGGFGPHATIIMIFSVQYWGLLCFHRALTGQTSPLVALLIVPLLYSFIFNWGFANFLLGLGLVFWAAAWWLTQRHRLAVALPVACLLATLIFIVHGLAFALYGVLVAALEFGIWWQAKPRRLAGLVNRLAPLLVQAVVPVMLFLSAPTSRTPEGLTNADESVVRLARAGTLGERLWELVQYRLVTIVRVAEGPSLAFDLIAMTLTIALLVLLARRQRLGIAPQALPALLAFALLVIIVPPAMFSVGYVADRMPLALAMLLVGALVVTPRHDRLERNVTAALAALVAVRLAGIAIAWQGYAADQRDFRAVAQSLPRDALIESIVVNGGNRLDSRRRCAMFGPQLIVDYGAAGRVFANSAMQPLVITGPLATAIEKAHRPRAFELAPAERLTALMAAAARGGFGWVLLCDAVDAGKVLPPGASIAANRGRFTLVRMPAASDAA